MIKLRCELGWGGTEVDQIVVAEVGKIGGSGLSGKEPDTRCCESEAVVCERLASVEVLDCRSGFCAERNVGGGATEIGVYEKDAEILLGELDGEVGSDSCGAESSGGPYDGGDSARLPRPIDRIVRLFIHKLWSFCGERFEEVGGFGYGGGAEVGFEGGREDVFGYSDEGEITPELELESGEEIEVKWTWASADESLAVGFEWE